MTTTSGCSESNDQEDTYMSTPTHNVHLRTERPTT
jgi:hypothetical protein